MRLVFVFSLVAAALAAAPSVTLAQAPPANVDVSPVQRDVVELTRPLVATVEPVIRSTIAAEQPGRVTARHFEEGQAVESGRVLVEVDTALLDKLIVSARAQQASAEAELKRAEVSAVNARRELERQEQLFERNVSPEKEVLDARTFAEEAEALVAVRESEVAEREADVARLELQKEKSSVTTPVAGVVRRRMVEVGQWIETGDDVAQVVALDQLWVAVNVPEAVIPLVKVGQTARVSFQALGGKELEATVEQILPEGDAGSRTFLVRLRLDNPGGEVRPGFFARAVITAELDDSGLFVPRDAVITSGTNSHVVVARDGVAAIVPVTLGAANAQSVSVTPRGELAPGDLVVIRGGEGVFPGQPLIIRNGGATPPAGSGEPDAGGAGSGGASAGGADVGGA
ncbi:MAG: efflux RND transporter periplasmic adaptor subunit [Phycisphaerae bacterium]